MHRWSIYIDVEGFGAIYALDKGRALLALSRLMEALYQVGTKAFPNSPDRLFIHQFGDGFVVVSDFTEPSPERPLALSIAVMRHLLAQGVATKTAISAGDFGDVFGCYPQAVQNATDERHRHVPIGEGLMTIIPVMGMALIAPYKLANTERGAVLLLDSAPFTSIPTWAHQLVTGSKAIDWIHVDCALIAQVGKDAGLIQLAPGMAAQFLRKYIEAAPRPSERWISSTFNSVALPLP